MFFFVLFFFVGFVFGILMSGKRGKGSNTSAYLSDPHSILVVGIMISPVFCDQGCEISDCEAVKLPKTRYARFGGFIFGLEVIGS